MIKDIVKDRDFLSKPAEPAMAEDAEVAEDLRDTIESLEDCVCLAANQIGSNKAIIAYEDNGRIAVMFNPKIKMAAQPYQTQESCLSLEEVSEVKRFQMISVGYQVISNGNLVSRTKRLSGWTAELVQHGIDHCAGKLV
ncbi:peptide deformylase [uncultured Enorma sp.]|uniref:peptide deformylase n=1 Tax=uncultured Enorma sp. TaxID=1714346 RepID=UPI00265F879C|nr:peptide deformylase [uncultured Enorma sp.]